MKGITLERLEVLKKLGESAGVLQAAGGSKSRQGLFSRQLRELEGACGMTLVDRRNRRIQLNQKGEAVVQRYEQLLEELGLIDSREESEPVIRIGGGEVALVEGVIPLLENHFEDIETTLQFRNLRSSDSIRLFRRGELDLVLSSVAPKPLREGEECRMLFEEGYVIVTPSEADQSEGLFLKTLVKQKLVLLEGKTPIRIFLENEALKLRQKLRLGALCSTYGQILNLVEKGHFVGVIPAVCSQVALEKGLRVKRLLSDKPPSYQFWLLYRMADPTREGGLAIVLKALGAKRP
ncbi:MAG: DNA-binding transcriptional LysR family regulator [Akkermansiaceae bacterium]|jgi:DNA-binding transcriptional LysR family regulator